MIIYTFSVDDIPVSNQRIKHVCFSATNPLLHQAPSTEEFKNATITCHFGILFEETGTGKSRDYRDVIIFEKRRFKTLFCPHENEKPAFSNSSGFKAFSKSFVVWRDGYSVDDRPKYRNKSPFSNSSCEV